MSQLELIASTNDVEKETIDTEALQSVQDVMSMFSNLSLMGLRWKLFSFFEELAPLGSDKPVGFTCSATKPLIVWL